MILKKIVITGGPSTGKTAVLSELENRGYTCIPEFIRMLTRENLQSNQDKASVENPILSADDPLAFNQNLIDGRIAQYELAVAAFQKKHPTKLGIAQSAKKLQHNAAPASKLLFFDRGIPDVMAYMQCFGQKFGLDFKRSAYTYRYDAVLMMPPWPEIYTVDNERLERFDTAVRVHDALQETYAHFNYTPINIPKLSITDRVDFILNLKF